MGTSGVAVAARPVTQPELRQHTSRSVSAATMAVAVMPADQAGAGPAAAAAAEESGVCSTTQAHMQLFSSCDNGCNCCNYGGNHTCCYLTPPETGNSNEYDFEVICHDSRIVHAARFDLV